MDYVVVGGGIYGATVTWELAKRGAEVTLVEAKTIASGASGGLGKRGVRGNGRDAREIPLMAMSYEIWPTLHEEIGAPTGYDRQGHLLVYERERDVVKSRAQMLVQNQLGIPSHWLEPDHLFELEPDLRRNMLGAIHCPLDGIADHTATTVGTAQAAAKEGAVIQENCQVTSLEIQSGRVTAVLTSHDSRIPVAKGCFLMNNMGAVTMLAKQFGLQLPIYLILPQVMLTDAIDPMPVRHLIGHAHRTLAMKNNPDGRVMISGGWLGRYNPETGQNETVPDQVVGNLGEAQAVYPVLEGIGVSEASADRPEGICHDGVPIIDHIPGITNAVFATGWSGHGWAIAPATSKLIADWAWTGSQPELLRPFNLGRFGL